MTTARVRVERATVDDVDALTDAWVALAAEQRQHGSQLRAEDNRAAVREDLSRRAVLGEALVARLAEDGAGEREDADRTADDERDDTVTVAEVEVSLDADDLAGETTDEPADLPPWFVGFVSFGMEVDGFERADERGVVHNLYVRPGARSRGVGAALLSAAEAELAAAGADRVALEALADNDAARAFYRRAGYGEHRVELEKDLE